MQDESSGNLENDCQLICDLFKWVDLTTTVLIQEDRGAN